MFLNFRYKYRHLTSRENASIVIYRKIVIYLSKVYIYIRKKREIRYILLLFHVYRLCGYAL